MAKEAQMKKEANSAKDDSKSSAFKMAQEAVRKLLGEGASMYLSEYDSRILEVVSTGSYGLDYALGIGGLELGKMVEVLGRPGTGKTTLAISAAANALKKFPEKKVLYVDAENAFNSTLGVSMGLDPKRTIIVSAQTAEQNLTAAEMYIKSGEFSVTIFDSVSALIPQAEYEATYEDQFMGLHARLMSRMCRSIKPLCSKTGTLLILINQLRNKIGSYGAPEIGTGGEAIPFYSDFRIKVFGGESKSTRILDENGEPMGHRATFEVIKNKKAVPYKKCTVDLVYGHGFDNLGELVDVGEEMGLVEKTGAWIKYGELKFNGKEKFKAAMLSDKELFEKLKADVFSIFNKTNG